MSWLNRFFKLREKTDGDDIKPFLEHVEDLRWTLIRMALIQVTTMAGSLYFRIDLIHLLKAPLFKLNPVPTLMTTGIADSFIISLELAFFAGLALAFPLSSRRSRARNANSSCRGLVPAFCFFSEGSIWPTATSSPGLSNSSGRTR
jgi:hypothetical protein